MRSNWRMRARCASSCRWLWTVRTVTSSSWGTCCRRSVCSPWTRPASAAAQSLTLMTPTQVRTERNPETLPSYFVVGILLWITFLSCVHTECDVQRRGVQFQFKLIYRRNPRSIGTSGSNGSMFRESCCNVNLNFGEVKLHLINQELSFGVDDVIGGCNSKPAGRRIWSFYTLLICIEA